MAGESDAFVLLILACIFPPAAVAFVAGCGGDLCLNILLTMLGYLPGCLHAFWLVLRRAEANERYGYKNWTYAGMGEYRPAHEGPPGVPSYGQDQPPPPAPPPPGQYPHGNAPQPSQPPADQKGGYAVPPPPAESKSGGGSAADQKSPPSALAPPADQKYSEDPAPPQAPDDRKQADTTAQYAAPPGSS